MSSHFPEGGDENRVKKVIEHYEQQSDLEAVAEDEASLELNDQTYIEIPKILVPKVRELLAQV